MNDIKIYPNAPGLAQGAAEHFITLADVAITTRGQFAVALSGGSTPRPVYERLATKEFAGRVDWSRVHLFWGDERCVPPEHPDSNYRMARQTLLDHVPIPPLNVHRIAGEIEPEEAAAAYEHTLRRFFSEHRQLREGEPIPRFDLVLLGIGEDGHTASLFPGTAALRERTRWVMALYADKLHTWRITLTPVAINSAACVTFVVSGASKAEQLRKVLIGLYQPDLLPAQLVRPTAGRLLWLVDAEAAALLRPTPRGSNAP